MKWLCPFLIILCFESALLNAQTVVHGKIFEQKGSPVGGVSIVAKGVSESTPSTFSISGADGSFSFVVKTTCPSTIVAAVSHINYRHFDTTLNLTCDTLYLSIYLTEHYHALDSVTITSKPDIVIKKDTVVFKLNAFAKGNEGSLEEVLHRIPGFSVSENGAIMFNGQALTRVLIEGNDLFGSEYQKLTRNITPDAIDEIEVIDNYNDPDDYEARFSLSKQKVLNLKLHADKKLNWFGNSFISGGIPLKRYDAKLNSFALQKKVQNVTNARINSTGENLKSSFSPVSEWREIGTQQKIISISSPLRNELSGLKTNDNNSSNVGNQLKIRAREKVLIQLNSSFENDSYTNFENSRQIIQTIAGKVDVIEKQRTQSSVQNWRQYLTAKWAASKKLQIDLAAYYEDIEACRNLVNLVNDISAKGKESFYLQRMGLKAKANFILKPNQLLTSSVTYFSDDLRGRNNFLSPALNLLLADSNVSANEAIVSTIDNSRLLEFTVNWQHLSTKGKISIQSSFKRAHNPFSSRAGVPTDSGLALLQTLSFANKYYTAQTGVRFTYSNEKRNFLSFWLEPLLVNQTLTPRQSTLPRETQNAFLSHGISLRRQYSNNLHLAANYVSLPALATSPFAFAGNQIRSIRNVVSGAGQFQNGYSHEINLFFSRHDPAVKQQFFFANMMYRNAAQLYIPIIVNTDLSFRQQYVPTRERTHFFLWLNNFDKYFHGIRSTLSLAPSFSFNSAQAYFGDQPVRVNLSVAEGRLKFRTNPKNWFTTSASIGWSGLFQQHSLAQNYVQKVGYRMQMEFAIKEKLFLNTLAEGQIVINKLNSNHNFFLGFDGLYKMSKRLDAHIQLSNLLNQNAFQNILVYTDLTTIREVKTIPFIFLTGFRYRFQ